MRAILGSYDSELTPAEYSPQLTRRMREAEDMVQKVHAHSSEMEVSAAGALQEEPSSGARPPYADGRCAGRALALPRGGLLAAPARLARLARGGPPARPPGPCVQVSVRRATRAGSVLGAACPAWSPAHTCHSLRLSAGA